MSAVRRSGVECCFQ